MTWKLISTLILGLVTVAKGQTTGPVAATISNPVPQVQTLWDAYNSSQTFISSLTAQLATQNATDLSIITGLRQQLAIPSAINYYVDSITGSDSNAGTVTLPFKTIQHAITVSSQSKPVIFAYPGTYSEHLIFRDYADLRGVVGQTIIDGKNTLPVLAESGQHVSIRGIRFTGAYSPALAGAVKPNNYWLMQDCEIDHCSQAATDTHGTSTTALIHDVILQRVLADHNGAEGFKGGFCQVVEDHCESSFNNTGNASVLNEAGGGKYLQSNGCQFLSCNYHDNNGPGLWMDYNNINYTISDLYTSRNTGASGMGIGLVIEISQGPGTVLRYHGSGNGNSDLGIFESTNVTVQDSRLNAYLRNNSGRGISIQNISFIGCVGSLPVADSTKNVIIK